MAEFTNTKRYTVLIAESHALGSIAVIRSLGRAGYHVHAVSSKADALGFKSRYTDKAVLHPPYKMSEEFINWLRDHVRKYDICVIVPSEGFLVAIRGCFEEFAHLIPFGPSAETIYRGLSKYDLFDSLLASSDAGQHMPLTRLIHDTAASDAQPDIEGYRLPIFIKADAVYSRDGSESCTRRCETYGAARLTVEELSLHYERLIVQEHVPGVGVGAFFLSWQGSIYAEFMHQRIHEVPHTGGVSSFRRSWFDKDVQEDARRKLELLGWQGVGMFEYRWNSSSGEFYLMELNGRFWGSLHLALFAGIDFPAMLVACHLGHHPEPAKIWRDVSSRYTFPREFEYVISILKDSKLPISLKFRTVCEFFWLGFDPRIKADLLYRGDYGLYWQMLFRTLRIQSGNLMQKLTGWKETKT